MADKIKRKYRFLADGHFMGTYRRKYDVIDLYPKQAKYAIYSGQLEAIEPASPIAAKDESVEPVKRRRINSRVIGTTGGQER